MERIIKNNTDTISYRPCIVRKVNRNRTMKRGKVVDQEEFKDYRAVFHHWSERFWTVGESLMTGGHAGGQISQTVAIVEYEDGTVHECYPEEIRFLESKVKEYSYCEERT